MDSNRLGTWNRGSFDIKERGPDPINVCFGIKVFRYLIILLIYGFIRNLMILEKTFWLKLLIIQSLTNKFVKFY